MRPVWRVNCCSYAREARGSLLPHQHYSYSHSAPARATGGHPETGERNFGAHPTEKESAEIRLDDSAIKLPASYPWPGNIREMRNILERAAQIAQPSLLAAQDLG